jgi:hypothetical protein
LDDRLCSLQKLYGNENCAEIGTGHGTLKNCSSLLERAPWIPSYREAQAKLSIPNITQIGWNNGKHTHADKMPAVYMPPYRYDTIDEESTFMHDNEYGNGTMRSRLYQQGHFFLYGLLFAELFPRIQTIPPESFEMYKARQHGNKTFAVHVRHVFEQNDGSNISLPADCLRKIVSPGDRKNCTVFVMSDRLKTLQNLRAVVENELRCSYVTANHHHRGTGLSGEHGPFAGVGMFQDLQVGRQARDGFVGNLEHSSTRLLLEMIEHDRFIEHQNAGKHGWLASLPTCSFATL